MFIAPIAADAMMLALPELIAAIEAEPPLMFSHREDVELLLPPRYAATYATLLILITPMMIIAASRHDTPAAARASCRHSYADTAYYASCRAEAVRIRRLPPFVIALIFCHYASPPAD